MENTVANQNNPSSSRILMLVLSAFFTALVAVGGFIRVPLPLIPITLQTMIVMLAGMFLGKKYAPLSLLMYMVLGLIGIPIFTMGGGIGCMLKPTFGYIIGFIPASFVIGLIARGGNRERPGLVRLIVASLVGIFIIYFFGVTYWYILGNFILASPIAVKTVMVSGAAACLPGDLIKAIFSVVLANRLIPVLSKYTDI